MCRQEETHQMCIMVVFFINTGLRVNTICMVIVGLFSIISLYKCIERFIIKSKGSNGLKVESEQMCKFEGIYQL